MVWIFSGLVVFWGGSSHFISHRMGILPEGPAMEILQWSGYILLGFIAQVFFYSILEDALSVIFRSRYPVSVRGKIMMLLIAFCVLTSAHGVWISRQVPPVHQISIQLKGLPKSFAGYNIVQLTDLHIGAAGYTRKEKWLEKIIDRVNALNPDLIVLTGDLIEGDLKDVKSALLPLQKLKALDGVFLVTGNHEFHSGIAIEKQFQDLGLQILSDENRRITRSGDRSGESIILAGVMDPRGEKPGYSPVDVLNQTLRGVEKKDTIILLSHQPKYFDEAVKHGVSLQFSGHTHGGQFFPVAIIAHLVHRYPLGLYRVGDSILYVNPGAGYWGPPLRFGVPAEIAEMELRP